MKSLRVIARPDTNLEPKPFYVVRNWHNHPLYYHMLICTLPVVNMQNGCHYDFLKFSPLF